MPYTTANPPSAVKGLPSHAIEIYVAAFNSAFEQYNDEGKAAATAWAAVKTKYEKNEKGDWIAKEANVKESELSAEDKRTLLQGALEQKFPSSDRVMPSGTWVADVFDTEIVYRQDGIDYKVSYVIDTEGKVTLGEPVKVKRQTIYTPMESLRRKHSEIIQEIGRRNASADAGRIKQIMLICQELLSSELAPEEKVAEALKEADLVLAWLKEQPTVKTEDGVQYPAEAYAYIPEPEHPSTWKLRLWEDAQKRVTERQLNKVSAYLSPGGHKGELNIPLQEVKRKIRSEYRNIGIEEMPRWVKEAEMRTFLANYIPLTEAKLDKGVATVDVIQAGFNSSKDRYYPLDTLVRDYSVFEGLKMYADHPSEDDERNRPERSIRDWVASLKKVHVEGDKIVGEAHIVEPWFQEKLATLRDKGMLNELGVSINAVGAATEATIEGTKTNYIERIARGRSVDFVTEAGAGGLVEMYEAERDVDVDFITLTTLRERRPELVKEIETSVRNSLQKEVRKLMETEERVKELETQIAALTLELDRLKKEKETAETKATVEAAVSKAELPAPAKARLLERFKDSTKADGLEEAIQGEKDYIAAVTEAGKVTGLGPKGSDEDGTKALAEVFKRANPKWTDKQVEIAVRGR